MEQLSQDDPDREPAADLPKAEEREVESVPVWGPVQRALFRFLFSYLVLYILPFPLNVIPVYGEILRGCEEIPGGRYPVACHREILCA